MIPTRALLTAVLLLASAAPAALAQKEIPKAEGHDQCPLGYVNTLGLPVSPPSISKWRLPTVKPARRDG